MIEMRAVTLTYPNGVQALSEIDVHITPGEFVFLVGPTGSGKSSFLRLINREVVPTGGRIVVNGQDLSTLKQAKVPYLRRKIGVVFQDFKLLLQKTVYENVAYALHAIGVPYREIRRRVSTAVDLVGLGRKADVGRTGPFVRLGHDPAVGLHDPPHTGAADRRALPGQQVMDGVGPGIQASARQLIAQLHDPGADRVLDARRARPWS